MHSLNLETWVQRMMFWDNGADALALYSLSDMLGINTTVLTKSKPWTTVSGNFQGDIYDLLHISEVTLAYLGQDKYARLWKKSARLKPVTFDLTSISLQWQAHQQHLQKNIKLPKHC